MSRKIIGITVGTPMKPQKVIEQTHIADQVAKNTQDISELSGQKIDKAGITLGYGDDGLLYVLIDGKPCGQGVEIGSTIKKYKITLNLTKCTSSNNISYVEEGKPFETTITANNKHIIEDVAVTMGGTDITSAVYLDGVIAIPNVTGNVVVTIVAIVIPDNITLSDVDSSFQSETEALVTTINATNDNTVNFVILTDTHGSSNGQKSQNVVRYLLKNSKADKLFHLGDMVSNLWDKEEFDTYFAPFEYCIPQIYPALGNHEQFGGSGLTTVYNTFLADKTDITGVPEDIYYYLDDTTHKVRYLVLNTSDGGTNKVSNEQIEWIKSAVQLPTNEWGIVILSHYPFNSINPPISDDTTMYSSYFEEINNALYTTNGSIISHFCGHVHVDNTSVVDYTYYEQILLNDGVSGQAISIVSIDLDTSNVTIHRIGVGDDISYNYKDLSEDSYYTVTNNLTNVTNNNGTSQILEGKTYSATLTPVADYEISSVTVTMGGTDITSTSYSNRIITINEVTGNIVITATAEPLVLVEEYTADWLIKDETTTNYPSFKFSSAKDVYDNFPDVLSVIVKGQGTNTGSAFPTGFRGQANARFATRTSGWTTHYHTIISYTDNPENYPLVVVDGCTYCYFTITKNMVNTAYESYTTAINNGQFDRNELAGMSIGSDKTMLYGNDCWVIAQEVTDDVIRRLPSHS